MTAIACHSTLFDRMLVRLGENAKARGHERHLSPTPSASRLESGLKPPEIRSMGQHASPLLCAPSIAKPGVPTPRSIATAKSP